MLVVLDANIYVADFRMRSASFRVFLEGVSGAGGMVVMPRVVRQEVEAKFDEHLRDASRKATGAVRSLRRFLADERGLADFDADWENKARESFAEFLDSFAAREDVQVVGLPSVDHEILVRRAITKRRPHAASGAGYRDDLIWHNVLDLAKGNHDRPIYFVSANKSDFAAPAASDGSGLHPDLLTDLSDIGAAPGAVQWFPGLQEFNAAVLVPLLKVSQITGTDWQSAEAFDGVADAIAEELEGKELYQEDLPELPSFESASIAGVYEPSEVELTAARVLPSGELVIDADVTADCDLDLYVYKADYWASADYYGEHGIEVSDHDWNDHVLLASALTQLRFSVTLTASPDLNMRTALDVIEFEMP
jgi:hypothetical protein